jgi:hypothetical protein
VAPALGSVQNRLDPSCQRRASSSTPALASRSPNASLLLTAPTMPISLLQGQSRAPDSLPYFLVQYPILNALSHHHSKPDRRRTTSESLATRFHTETPSPSQKPTSLATQKKGRKTPTSLTSPANFPSPPLPPFPSGIAQLLTPHHHRLIFPPMLLPLKLALRFQYRHPLSTSVHSVPCTSGSTTWSRIVIYATFPYVSASFILAR